MSMQTITTIDAHLAQAYFTVLVEVAKQKKMIPYGQLVDEAKRLYPNDPVIQSAALAVSAGRRLNVVRIFTSQHDMPDLTSLAISKSAGECGAGFLKSFDPEAVRKEVYAFDWHVISSDFSGFVEVTQKEISARKAPKIKEPEALQMMHTYYKAHKDTLPKNIAEYRPLIIELLMAGLSPEQAFEQAVSSTANL
jgi:hypothetical protein